jgi:hypothetical protein
MASCHPFRRKKHPNGRSWRKSWRRITARLPMLRPSWYARFYSPLLLLSFLYKERNIFSYFPKPQNANGAIP